MYAHIAHGAVLNTLIITDGCNAIALAGADLPLLLFCGLGNSLVIVLVDKF